MAQDRVRGYVVGHDVHGGAIVWIIRINEPDHPFNGKKYDVGSFYPGMCGVKPGMAVTFILGEYSGSAYNMALDVRRDTTKHPQCAYCTGEADVLFRFSRTTGGLTSIDFKPACLSHYCEIGSALSCEVPDRTVDVKNIWREQDEYRAW